MLPTLLENLRALAAGKHSDVSFANEAADEIERLRFDIRKLRVENESLKRAMMEAEGE